MSEQNSSAPIIVERHLNAQGVGVLVCTLNNPKALNALSLAMIDALDPVLRAAATDPAIKAVILQGAGEKAFCAGGDIVNLYRAMREHQTGPDAKNPLANQLAVDFFTREYVLDYLMHTFSKPLICVGHGIVMGGGMGLMQACSHRLITPVTRIAMPEINIGLFPDVGGSWFLQRLPGRLGLFLALTAAQLNAADAMYAGLADVCVSQDQLPALVPNLLAADWSGADAYATVSSCLHQMSAPHGLESNLLKHFEWIQSTTFAGGIVPICEAILNTQSDDTWVQRAIAGLRGGSPTTAALSFELLKRARNLSLADVFAMELVVAVHCCAKPDFVEGVRALLVEKTKDPRWSPAHVQEVTHTSVASFFDDPWPAGKNPLSTIEQRVQL